MHLLRSTLLLLLSSLALAPSAAAAPPEAPTAPGRPELPIYLGRPPPTVQSRSRVEGAHARRVFEPVLQGALVRHEFLVPNPGPEPLELSDLQACSGCIVERWSRRVAPGGEGRIALVLVTDSRGGEEIAGTLRVRTDDPQRPEIRIEVSLRVEELAEVEPYRVWLRGAPGEPIVARCRITPNERHPFRVIRVVPRRGVWFEHELRPVQHNGRRAWEILLRNTRRKPGPYQDVLFVQTDHPERPEIKVRVEGRIGMPDAGR
jgi:hypothetical protein